VQQVVKKKSIFKQLDNQVGLAPLTDWLDNQQAMLIPAAAAQRHAAAAAVFAVLLQVARLAVQLPQGRMDKMARRLNRVAGQEEEFEGDREEWEEEEQRGGGQQQHHAGEGDDEDLL
jgi:hypothetical protein